MASTRNDIGKVGGKNGGGDGKRGSRRPGAWRLLALPVARRFSRYPGRYVEIVAVLRKHKLHQLAAQLGMRQLYGVEAGEEARPAQSTEHGQQLAAALEELGPCFIKLGQLLSTRPDLLPPAYIQGLSRLQSRITPVPVDEIVEIIESELGGPLDNFYATFDRKPLAAASMAQVHRATLHDGSEVVAKVLRPGVRERTAVDIVVLKEMVRFAKARTSLGMLSELEQMVRELEEGLAGDVDYRLEIANTQRISRQLADFPLLATPRVYPELSSGRVLTLSFVRGRHLARLSREEIDAYSGPEVAKQLLEAYLKQIVIDGIFHCDPHPGNILMAGDGRLTLLDFGMVGRFAEEEKERIIRLLLAFANREGRRMADTYLEMVEIPRGFARQAFTQAVGDFVSRYNDLSGGRMGLGTAFLELLRIADTFNAPIPSSLTLLSKAMFNLDGTVSALSPNLDPVELIRNYMMDVMQQRILAETAPNQTISWALDAWHLVEHAPRQVDQLLEKLANDRLTVQLRISELEESTRSLERIVNNLSRSVIFGSWMIAAGYVLGSILRAGRRRGPG